MKTNARRLADCDNTNYRPLKSAKYETELVKPEHELAEPVPSVPDSVKTLVVKAVERCPLDMDSWIDFAKTKNYEDVKTAINEIMRILPREVAIWITAAKLEEFNGKRDEWVERIVERSVWVMKRDGGVIEREAWTEMAEDAERAGYVTTSRAMFANLYRIRARDAEKED